MENDPLLPFKIIGIVVVGVSVLYPIGMIVIGGMIRDYKRKNK